MSLRSHSLKRLTAERDPALTNTSSRSEPPQQPVCKSSYSGVRIPRDTSLGPQPLHSTTQCAQCLSRLPAMHSTLHWAPCNSQQRAPLVDVPQWTNLPAASIPYHGSGLRCQKCSYHGATNPHGKPLHEVYEQLSAHGFTPHRTPAKHYAPDTMFLDSTHAQLHESGGGYSRRHVG